jgi:hypothetical protein
MMLSYNARILVVMAPFDGERFIGTFVRDLRPCSPWSDEPRRWS